MAALVDAVNKDDTTNVDMRLCSEFVALPLQNEAIIHWLLLKFKESSKLRELTDTILKRHLIAKKYYTIDEQNVQLVTFHLAFKDRKEVLLYVTLKLLPRGFLDGAIDPLDPATTSTGLKGIDPKANLDAEEDEPEDDAPLLTSTYGSKSKPTESVFASITSMLGW